MHVLITGATGFIGGHLAAALLAAGHRVSAAARTPRGLPAGARFVGADFTADHDAAVWVARLAAAQPLDAVVNAVGILRERGAQRFEALHWRAPRALFGACAQLRVARVLQVSALGADAGAASGYHLSKRAADDWLLQLPLAAAVVQPSLVYGLGGASATLFNTLASLPLLALPGGGRQPVQPIHIDDLTAALLALLTAAAWRSGRIALVGPQPLALADYLAPLRATMALPRAPVLPVPQPLARVAARAAARLPGALLDPDALAMLERGSVADAAATSALLGRPPRPPAAFIPRALAPLVARDAQLAWLLPLLRLALAAVWIGTAWVSLFGWPRADSYELLGRSGVPAALQPPMLLGAALLDLLLGLATLALPRRRRPPLWWAQLLLVGFYSAVIAWRLPEFWLHPYGPLLKNVVIVAVLVLLLRLDRAPAETGPR